MLIKVNKAGVDAIFGSKIVPLPTTTNKLPDKYLSTSQIIQMTVQLKFLPMQLSPLKTKELTFLKAKHAIFQVKKF